MHVLFCTTLFFICLPWDSTRTIEGLVKVLCLIPSCIAKLEYFNRPKVLQFSCFSKARPRKQVSNGRPRKQNDLASLSTEVLRLRLQALNLPIMGGKAALISRLNLAAGTKSPLSTSNPQAGRARTKRLAPESRPVRATFTTASTEFTTKQANLEDPGDDSSSFASAGGLNEIMEEFSSDDSPDPVQAGPFTAAQLAAIQDTVRSSLDQALQSVSIKHGLHADWV